MDLALVRPAVLQQRLELRPIRCLGALALFVESFEDLVALAAAILSFIGDRFRLTALAFPHYANHRPLSRPPLAASAIRVRPGPTREGET
jgi:hypothetical protein